MGGGARWSIAVAPSYSSPGRRTGTHAEEACSAVISVEEFCFISQFARPLLVQYLLGLVIHDPDDAGFVVSKFCLIWNTCTIYIFI